MLDHSYGLIPIFTLPPWQGWVGGGLYTILVKLASGNHRWLPKGHPDPGENPLQTAIRELREETGLTVDPDQVDTSRVYTESYSFTHPTKGHIDKTVEYYIAHIPYPIDLTLWSHEWSEILDKRLLPLEEAIDLVTYDATREVLREIQKIQ